MGSQIINPYDKKAHKLRERLDAMPDSMWHERAMMISEALQEAHDEGYEIGVTAVEG